MFKWLQKIFFLTITFSFLISAIEIDLGKSHNTFFDEYDTYVCAEDTFFNHTSATLAEHDSYLLFYNLFTGYNYPNRKPAVITHRSTAFFNHSLTKLFERNSVWRI